MMEKQQFEIPEDRVRLGVMASLLRIYVEIYADEKRRKILDGLNGEEIVIEFPNLGGSILFKIYNRRLLESVGSSEDAATTLIMRSAAERVVEGMTPILGNSNNLIGILRLLSWILRGNVGFRGSMMKGL